MEALRKADVGEGVSGPQKLMEAEGPAPKGWGPFGWKEGRSWCQRQSGAKSQHAVSVLPRGWALWPNWGVVGRGGVSGFACSQKSLLWRMLRTHGAEGGRGEEAGGSACAASPFASCCKSKCPVGFQEDRKENWDGSYSASLPCLPGI